MCGRLFLVDPPAFVKMSTLFLDLPKPSIDPTSPVMQPRYNVAPQQPLLAVVGESGKSPVIRELNWGFVPAWSKEPPANGGFINARGETILDKPSFRDAMRGRRCLIPASGFYEWQKLPSDSRSGTKQPYAIRLQNNGGFAFAGVWETFDGVDGCAVCTCEPNELLAELHHRMAVILPRKHWRDWLDVDRVPAEQAAALLRPLPSDQLRAYPVSTDVGSVGNDDPSLIEEIDPADHPADGQHRLFA